MSYADKNKKRATIKKYRKDNRERYNELQRKYQKAWRDKNKDKVKDQNTRKKDKGIFRKSSKLAREKLSDSYLRTIASRQPGKSLLQKRSDVLKFRIKKIIKEINGENA